MRSTGTRIPPESLVVGRRIRLGVFSAREDDAIDERARDLRPREDLASCRRDPLDLDDDHPPEFWAAMAIARLSSVSASRSMVMFPSGSAVVPRKTATLMGNDFYNIHCSPPMDRARPGPRSCVR